MLSLVGAEEDITLMLRVSVVVARQSALSVTFFVGWSANFAQWSKLPLLISMLAIEDAPLSWTRHGHRAAFGHAAINCSDDAAGGEEIS